MYRRNLHGLLILITPAISPVCHFSSLKTCNMSMVKSLHHTPYAESNKA